jgi:hypothetical protein
MKGKNILLGSVAAFGMSAMSHGQLIDIALGNGTTNPVGAAVLGNSGDIWNVFDASFGSFGPFAVSDVAGHWTGASVSVLCDGGTAALNTPSQPLPDLTHCYAFDNTGGWIALEVEGLAANQKYNLVLYVASDDAAEGDRSVAGTVFGASNVAFTATGNPESSFVNGENVVDLNVVSNSHGAVTILEGDGTQNTSGEVDLSGLQIKPAAVPEPATLGILAIGIVSLIARRRRKKSS